MMHDNMTTTSALFEFSRLNYVIMRESEPAAVGIKSLQLKTSLVKHRIHLETNYFDCESNSLNQFECRFCDFVTSLKLASDRHKVLVHRHPGCSDPEIELTCYVCNKCGFQTYSLLVFARHICVDSTITEGNVKVEECKQCLSKSDKFSKLKHHMNEFNCESSILKQLECQFCDFKTGLKLAVERHKSLIHRHPECSDLEVQLNYYICSKCNFETYSMLVFARHICSVNSTIINGTVTEFEHEQCTNSNSIKWHKCEQCAFKTKKQSNLKAHFLRTHEKSENVKRFKCEQCAYKTETKKHLEIHILNKHTDSKYVKWFTCEHCAYKSKSKSHLKIHVLRKHVNSENVKWFKCDHCTYKAKLNADVKLHIFNKHTDSESIQWHKCEHCAYKSKSKFNLKSHVLRKHTDSENVQWFKCEHCEYKAKTKIDLRLHILNKNTDPKSIQWHKCEHCTYKSKSKADVKRHILYKHTDSKSIQWHECDQCIFKTKTKSQLGLHTLRMHSSVDLKWLKCEHCSYKTKLQLDVKRHILNKHKNSKSIQWHKCEHCIFKTKTQDELKHHVFCKHGRSENLNGVNANIAFTSLIENSF